MDVIALRDGRIMNLGNDTDFYELIWDALGADAADWYRERIRRVDTLVRELDMYRVSHNDYAQIEKMGSCDLAEIAAIAFEIPGWDE